MGGRPLVLLPVGRLPPALLQRLAGRLAATLPVRPQLLLPPVAFPAETAGSVRSGALLDALLDLPLPSARWRVGVTGLRLLGADGREVLGEATVAGPAGVVSLAPLRHPDPARGFARLLTSTVHELGHMAGAEHCRETTCAMYPSRYVEDTDRKRAGYCTRCLQQVAGAFRSVLDPAPSDH